MAVVDFFLKIAGIKGESQELKHKNEIEVEAWSWGLTNPGAAAPAGAGKPTFQDFSFVKRVDRSSPRLALASATGEHIPQAILAVRRPTGRVSFEFLKVTLSDVQVSGYQGTAEGTEAPPMDSFSLKFSKIEFSYTMQKEDGSPDAPVTVGWDVKANKKV